MRDEKVLVSDEGTLPPLGRRKPFREEVLSGELVFPDVRYLSPFVQDDTMAKVLCWSYDNALITLQRVIRRQLWSRIDEPFKIDVPDLCELAAGFPIEERALLLEFWVKHHAVVRHFLPGVVPFAYYYGSTAPAGMTYQGNSWYTKGCDKTYN